KRQATRTPAKRKTSQGGLSQDRGWALQRVCSRATFVKTASLGTELMDARRHSWIWIAAAFCASLGLALCIIAVFGIHRSINLAPPATGRLAFLIFWPAYTGAALTSLFGNVFSPL